MTLYARHTDIPGLYDVFTATLEPVASELTRGQLDHIASQRDERVEIVPRPMPMIELGPGVAIPLSDICE